MSFFPFPFIYFLYIIYWKKLKNKKKERHPFICILKINCSKQSPGNSQVNKRDGARLFLVKFGCNVDVFLGLFRDLTTNSFEIYINLRFTLNLFIAQIHINKFSFNTNVVKWIRSISSRRVIGLQYFRWD